MIFKSTITIILFLLMFSCTSSSNSSDSANNSQNVANSAPPPIPTNTPTQPQNIETNAKLQLQVNSFLKSFGNMPYVPVYIKDEPIIKTGSETQKGVAYTTCENKKDPTIFVKKVFFLKANEKQLANILKHELVHAWFCRKGELIGHDERFRKKFKEIGGFGN